MKLVALYCPDCREPLAAENDHVLTSCGGCSQALYLDDEGVRRQKVFYVAPAGDQDRRYLPFWVYAGRVLVDRRETQGGGSGGQKESEAMWAEPRRLYVPAWELSMQTAQQVGSFLIARQPEFDFVTRPEGATLLPAVVTPADALKLLEFIVLAIEARRKDWLKSIAFRLEVGEPELWALPEGVLNGSGYRAG
jgi:hypothetical protein